MASMKRIKVRPLHATLFINLRLLMSCNNHSEALKTLLTEDVFVLPNSNKKASNEVIHFILNIWSKEKSAEKFKFCWPVLDRKQESQFQRGACSLLQELKSAHPEANLPTVSLALLLQPGGDKYCNFLLRVTMFLLSRSIQEILKPRTIVKSEDSLRSLIEETKRDVNILLHSAARSHANAVATLSQAEEFRKKLKEWWQSWEECEEMALLEFQKEANLLDVPNELKQKILSSPSSIKDFELFVIDLRNEIETILSRLEGSNNPEHQRVSSASPEGKTSNARKKNLNLEGLTLLKQKLLKGLSDLTLLLDVGKRQPSWLIHSEVASLEILMQDGQAADFMDEMEGQLRSAKRSGTRMDRRRSLAPSNVFDFSPSILRQVPPTPTFDINHLAANGVDCSPFWTRIGPLTEEKESLESLLSRWNCYENKVPDLTEENSTLAVPLSESISQQFAVKTEAEATPVEKFRPKERITPVYPRNACTPSNGSDLMCQTQKSFHDTSGEELPLGDVSLLELAEMHLTFDSASVSPEPPSKVQKAVTPPAEPVDVKPDLSSLLQRLQSVKAKYEALPSVLVKGELVSP